jgi:hypothetical protein
MSDQAYAKAQAQQKTVIGSSSTNSLLQRTCACGQHTIAGGECEECRKKREGMLQRAQRAFGPPSAPGGVPGSSPAQENGLSFNSAFDRASRFGQDFSRIPVHSSHSPALQPKLVINKPGDEYEQEANQVAEQVMHRTAVEYPISDDEDEAEYSLKRKQAGEPGANAATQSPDVPPIVHDVLNSSGGQPLDTTTRAFMEPRFSHDFSGVRVHTDAKAAESAREVNALAYTVGQDVVFGAGQYVPHSSTGQTLLVHELAHAIQQTRGGPSPSRFAPNASNERAAIQAASMVALGGVAIVGGASGVGIACAPRSLEVSLDPATLSFTELEGEINEIQQHLDANPVSSEENDRLREVQGALGKELAKRRKQEEGGGKRRPKVNTSQVPRSLTESLRIDETLPDAELYSEIDAIHATLGTRLHKEDRANLKAALVQLEAEKQRREGVAKAQARAAKIQSAFTPKVTSTDGEALIEVMGIVESIRPSETTNGLYTLVRDGKVLTITQEEYDKIRGAVQKILQDRLRRVRQKAEDAQNEYDAQKKINEDQYIVSGLVHFFGGIDDPGTYIVQNVLFARVNADAAQVLIERMQLKRAAEFFTNSEKFATIAKKTSKAYVDDLISTAETTVTTLEYTRDASFVTLGVLAIIATGGAAAAGGGAVTTTTAFGFEVGTATAANVIATGAPIVATLGSAGMQAALGDKVDWTKVGVDIAVNLILSKFGGKVSNTIFTRMLGNSSVRSIGAIAFGRIFSSLATHELSTAFTTSVDATYRKLKGQNVTWNQFTDELVDRLLDPKGLVVAGIMGAVVAGADVKLGGAKGVEIVDKKGAPIGEIDEIKAGVIRERKSAQGIGTINPKTGKPFPGSDESTWAKKNIYGKTKTRIENLKVAVESRPSIKMTEDQAQAAGSSVYPNIKELQGVRKYEFRIDADTPSLKTEVEAQMNRLRTEFPDWTFTAVFGK